VEVIPITKEENKLGNEALEEILNDNDETKMIIIMIVKLILVQKMMKVKKVICQD
jgi:hypothetical protein